MVLQVDLADSLAKTLMLRKTEDKKRRGWQMRWLSVFNTINMNVGKLQETVVDSGGVGLGVLCSMGSRRVRHKE